TQTPTLCAGSATGTVTITPAGGTGPYTITPAQTRLTAGLHTFTITDANGCTLTVDITIVDATPITETHTQTPTLCAGSATGTVTITPAGGTGPYTITPSQTGLTAGLHTFTITDANGCTTTIDVTIDEPLPIPAIATPTAASCNAAADGSVVITPSGGTAPYTITPSQTGLTPGLHTFTITHANGCTTTIDVTIDEPLPITATATPTAASCNGAADGSVVISPSGGTAPYTITPIQTGLTAGLHTFTITDANGCSTTIDVTIDEPLPITATATPTAASCNGAADGSVVITPSGGTGPYTITPGQTGLTAGLHTFRITDANGCSTTIDVTIDEPL